MSEKIDSLNIDIESLEKIILDWHKSIGADWVEEWKILQYGFMDEMTLILKGVLTATYGKKWPGTLIIEFEKDLNEDTNEDDYFLILNHRKGNVCEDKYKVKVKLKDGFGKIIIEE